MFGEGHRRSRGRSDRAYTHEKGVSQDPLVEMKPSVAKRGRHKKLWSSSLLESSKSREKASRV